MSKSSNTDEWFEDRPFPAQAWTPGLRHLTARKLSYLAAGWSERILVPKYKPNRLRKECRDVFELKSKRVDFTTEILLQAESALALVWPVQRLIGNPDDPITRSATSAMVLAALGDLDPVLFHFKTLFNRGRPYHCCNLALEPMFSRPDRLYPGHPSYPSGHSSQVHTIALLYAAMFPKLDSALRKAAMQVAINREIAGLHFRSDTKAGQVLAEQYVEELLSVPAFKDLVHKATAEWPELAHLRQ